MVLLNSSHSLNGFVYYFKICKIITIFCSCFIVIFLGSFIFLISLEDVDSPRKFVRHDLKKTENTRKPVQPVSKPKVDQSAAETPCQPLHYIPHAETRPVTALVSFPGSGNTWLRYLIQQCTGIHTGSQYVDIKLMKKGYPGESVFNSSVAVVKTHEWGPDIRNRFQKAVLLIRRPKSAIQSLFNLWIGGSHTSVVPIKKYEQNGGADWREFVNSYILDWQSTNRDWILNFTGPLHIVLYDQLRHDLRPTLRSIVLFLDLPLNETAIQCTIEHSEGLYHRKFNIHYDPYTEEMKRQIAEIEKTVEKELENYSKTRPVSFDISFF